jgi:hypothetical protein
MTVNLPPHICTRILEGVENPSAVARVSKHFRQSVGVENATRMEQFYNDIILLDPIALIDKYNQFLPVLPYMYLLYPTEFAKYAINQDRKLFHRLLQVLISMDLKGLKNVIDMIGNPNLNVILELVLIPLVNDDDDLPAKFSSKLNELLTPNQDSGSDRDLGSGQIKKLGVDVSKLIAFGSLVRFDEKKMFNENGDIDLDLVGDLFEHMGKIPINLLEAKSIADFHDYRDDLLLELYETYRSEKSPLFESNLREWLSIHDNLDSFYADDDFKLGEKACRLLLAILREYLRDGKIKRGEDVYTGNINELSSILMLMLETSTNNLELFNDVDSLIRGVMKIIPRIDVGASFPDIHRRPLELDVFTVGQERGYFLLPIDIIMFLTCRPEDIPAGYDWSSVDDNWDSILGDEGEIINVNKWVTVPTPDQLIDSIKIAEDIPDNDIKEYCLIHFSNVMWKFRIIEAIPYLTKYQHVGVSSNGYSITSIEDLEVYNRFYEKYHKTGLLNETRHQTVFDVMLTSSLKNHYLINKNIAIQFAVSKIIKPIEYYSIEDEPWVLTGIFKKAMELLGIGAYVGY